MFPVTLPSATPFYVSLALSSLIPARGRASLGRARRAQQAPPDSAAQEEPRHYLGLFEPVDLPPSDYRAASGRPGPDY